MDSDFRTRRGRLRGFSINRLIPNVLTLAARCSVSSVSPAFDLVTRARRVRR